MKPKIRHAVLAASATTLSGCQSFDLFGSGDDEQRRVALPAAPAAPVMVGGAAMLASNTIGQNVALSTDHETFVRAARLAGLMETLNGSGPFTVFAPTDEAFDRLGDNVVAALLQPAVRAQLTGILTFHILPGRVSSADILAAIGRGDGETRYTSVQGQILTATLSNGAILLRDERGQSAYVTIADANASNGTMHVINAVLAPRRGGAAG